VDLSVLTIEVGSTISKVNGFQRQPGGPFTLLAQGFAPTSAAAGDVGLGVDQALAELRESSGLDTAGAEIFINSSAAGGLRMTVHGLTRSMTVRAAREAALGAGALVKLVTSGCLDEDDMQEIQAVHPNIILLAGGVDFGDKETVLYNAGRLASLRLPIPIVYAGNAGARHAVCKIFEQAGIETLAADNVFPDVDVLNIEPVRRLVHEVFNRHIVHAPGMQRLGELTRWPVLPTPGAVLLGAELFAEALGDCLVFDVGGATTDVHSVTDGSLEWSSKMTEPEPRLKRSVEGDLGVFINAANIVKLAGDPAWEQKLPDLQALPATGQQIELTRWLCLQAVESAVRRHAGMVTDLYTPLGKRQVVKGKDLSAVRWVIGTGGALTRIPGGEEILRSVCQKPGRYLMPPCDVRILIDRDYRFSALGSLAQVYPAEVKATFQKWVEMEGLLQP